MAAAKLRVTAEEQAEIIRRYTEGESASKLAKRFPISHTTVLCLVEKAGIVPRSCATAVRLAHTRKLSEEERQEIAGLYDAGELVRDLMDAYAVGERTIRLCIKQYGKMRSLQEGIRLYNKWPDTHIESISRERWAQLYGKENGSPSLATLGRHFGVSSMCVKKYLIAAGIQPRTHSEQRRIDYLMGRWACNSPCPPRYKEGYVHPWKGKGPQFERTDRWRARISATIRARNPRAKLKCGWCGRVFERLHCQLWKKRPGWKHCCGDPCAKQLRTHLERHGEDTPRPVILEKLRDLWKRRLITPENKELTFEALQKIGEGIGAADAEYDEVMLGGL